MEYPQRMYVEVAVKSPQNRGDFIPLDLLPDYAFKHGFDKAVYRSVYLYPESDIPELSKRKTTKRWYGKRYIDIVPIDIDKGDDSDEFVHRRAISILKTLEDLGVQQENISIYYSGSGYHFFIHVDCFNFPEESDDLPLIVKMTATGLPGLEKECDSSVYTRTSLIRCTWTLNEKTKRYKIPLTWNELLFSNTEDILKLAINRREEFEFPEFCGDGELAKHTKIEIPKGTIKSYLSVPEPMHRLSCIYKMLSEGPVKGRRNNQVLRLSAWALGCGMSSDYAKALLLKWNSSGDSLDEQVVIDKVETTYRAGYRYGCQDKILQEYCSARCEHFKHQDHGIQIYGVEEAQALLEERMGEDFSGRILPVCHMYDKHKTDPILYPGEFISILGSTGTNKTTLVLNWVLGYDAVHGNIKREWQLPTLWVSMELSIPVMQRRALGIVADETKKSVFGNARELYNTFKDDLQHIKYVKTPPRVDDVTVLIRRSGARVIVIDYIELLAGEGNKIQKVDNAAHALSNLAVELDLIVIAISQINAADAKEGILSLYSAKYGGAVPDASRKVFGIEGDIHDVHRVLHHFKDNEGAVIHDIPLIFQETGRMELDRKDL